MEPECKIFAQKLVLDQIFFIPAPFFYVLVSVNVNVNNDLLLRSCQNRYPGSCSKMEHELYPGTCSGSRFSHLLGGTRRRKAPAA